MTNSLFSIFNQYSNLQAYISQRSNGSMKLTKNPELDKVLDENRKKFLKRLEIDPNTVVSADLIHGTNVQNITFENYGKFILNTDGLITDEKSLYLSITVADCLPIFLYDPQKEIISLIHAGWRGISANITKTAIEKMSIDFKSNPENILAGIGPGIADCHYEVGETVASKFKSLAPETLIKRDNKTFLDLKMAVRLQLLNAGLIEKNIEINPECTFCLSEKYFSFRRDKPENVEAMMVLFSQ